MADPDPVQDLRLEVAKVHELVRVVKHDRNNDAQSLISFERNMERMEKKQDKFDQRLEKLEEKLGDKIEANHTILTGKIDALRDSLVEANMKQARGVGFFAGVGAVFTLAITIILFLVKLIFDGGRP
jgi:chromosome segregation ATPase